MQGMGTALDGSRKQERSLSGLAELSSGKTRGSRMASLLIRKLSGNLVVPEACVSGQKQGSGGEIVPLAMVHASDFGGTGRVPYVHSRSRTVPRPELDSSFK